MLIEAASKVEIDLSTHPDATALTVLPPMSRHVREGLIAAGPYSSSLVGSCHLLYGALSVTDSLTVG
jgi:hypothetical protein